MVSIDEIQKRINKLMEEDIPEAKQLNEDCKFVIFFQKLIVKEMCN